MKNISEAQIAVQQVQLNFARKESKHQALKQVIKLKNREINNKSDAKGSILLKTKVSRKDTIPIGHCQICEEDTKINSKIFIAKCQHMGDFCESCLQQYAAVNIERFLSVHCPANNCTKILELNSFFFQLLPVPLQIKYRKIHRFYQVLSDPSLKLCPTDGCEGTIRLQTGKRKAHCKLCEKDFCSQCFLAFHEDNCDIHQQKFYQEVLNYRKCPQCKMLIQKFQGCNHLVCLCKYEFCYVCGEKWDQSHYLHDIQAIINGQVVHIRFIRIQQNPVANVPLPIEPEYMNQAKKSSQKNENENCIYWVTFVPRLLLYIIIFSLTVALLPIITLILVIGNMLGCNEFSQRLSYNFALNDACIKISDFFRYIYKKLLVK